MAKIWKVMKLGLHGEVQTSASEMTETLVKRGKTSTDSESDSADTIN